MKKEPITKEFLEQKKHDLEMTHKFICQLCEKKFKSFNGLSKHITRSHKEIINEEYYDKFLLKDKCLSICKNEKCNNKAKFKNLRDGYFNYCSRECYYNADYSKKKRKKTFQRIYGNNGCDVEATKKGFLKKYGIDNPFKLEKVKRGCKKTKLKRYGNENYNNPRKNIITRRKNLYENSFLIGLKNKHIKPLFTKEDFFKQQNRKYKCLKCNKIFYSEGNNYQHISCGCNGKSFKEIELYKIIKDFGIKDIIQNWRKKFNNNLYELDIFIPSYNLGIEFNGIYWHSELYKDRNYHQEKFLHFQKQHINLIQIFENEWENKSNIVLSIIKNKLDLAENKIFARKCKFRKVDSKESIKFLEQNHIQGSVNSKYKFGLFYKSELVSLMTIGKSRFKGDELELHRFCNKLNTNIVGGFSKLIKNFIRNYKFERIISYCDLRYFNGDGYKRVGFKELHITTPNYFYWLYNGNKFLNRLQCQKHKLNNFLNIFDHNLTEHENMLKNNYLRIYDAGNLKMEYINDESNR